ncbi:WD repeat-containing protein 64-like [Littorina saxatilis]|uniref:WD repeat-containing protein 64-like n=1 Tax=Littorina saxatilis TaxID=31220 RepID=UPI0038B51456
MTGLMKNKEEPAWVTGCDYLPGIRRVACCTERSIAIWDNRAKGKSQHIFIIKPIEHSPQCMTYVPSPQGSHEDVVLFGDDQGYVNVLAISAKDLNMKNSKGEKRNSQNVTIEPSKLSNPIVRRKIHGDWVLKVKYFPDLRCFASCSPSSQQSFVLEEPERLHDNGEVRGVSIPKGVNCFDYCARANIIATGGVDKIIRVWHPHIFSRPTGMRIVLNLNNRP